MGIKMMDVWWLKSATIQQELNVYSNFTVLQLTNGSDCTVLWSDILSWDIVCVA